MKCIYSPIFTLLLLNACTNPRLKTDKQNSNDNIIEITDSISSKSTRLEKNEDFKYNYAVINDNGIDQVLSVNILNKDSIAYKFVYSGNQPEKSIVIHGIAVLVPRDGDGESIVDDEGNFFFAEEYLSHVNDCSIKIRIDEDFQVAQLFANICINKLNKSQMDYTSIMALMN